jgi:hypothetical protein
VSEPPKRRRGRPSAGLTVRTALRALPEDLAQLEALTKRLSGFDQADVMRAALRLGMVLLELEPSLLMAGMGASTKRRAAVKALLRGGADG